jgi:peptidoglycan/LPS O-acetylase OafA/YrhL
MFPIHWVHRWYWYTFFAANIASASGKCSMHALTPLWSLAVEEQFYFVWPALVLLCDRKMLKRLGVAIMMGAPLLRALFTLVVASRAPIYRSHAISGGSVSLRRSDRPAHQRRPGGGSRPRTMGVGDGAVLGCVVGGVFAIPQLPPGRFGYSLIVLIFGSASWLALASAQGALYRGLTLRPLRYLGQISYTFYLYQVAVMDRLAQHIHSRFEIALGGFLITALISILSWHYVEQPILRLRLDPPSPTLQAGTA